MAVTELQARVLSVGFEGKILQALRQRFDVRCAIAEDSSADVDWDSLHLMTLPHRAPILTAGMMECLQALKTCYCQFNDINSRRFNYVPGRESETYNAFVLTFFTVYRLLKEHRIDLVLHANVPHEGFDFVLYQVAQFLSIKTVLCYQSLFPGRFWLTRTMEDFGRFTINPKIYARESSHYALPGTWFYMQGKLDDNSYSLSAAASEIIRKPHRLPPALIRYVYARQFRRQVDALTQNRGDGERYIYFPLHLQPELTTSALGGDYADQMLAIEALSTWLPSGHIVYLKENPKQTEKQRGPFFYKRLAALRNVKLLPRSENSIALIRGSVGVATVTGTAGWEALFHGKPVLTFGQAWYRDFPGVTQFDPASEFDAFLANQPPSTECLVAALDDALQTAGKGVIDGAYRSLLGNFDIANNATMVAESLSRYVEMTRSSSLPN